MVIPEAAVIAAAEAVYGMTLDGSIQRADWLKDFRIALEAAAPHLLAGAWEQGFLFSYFLERGYEDAATKPASANLADDLAAWNPYRSQEAK